MHPRRFLAAALAVLTAFLFFPTPALAQGTSSADTANTARAESEAVRLRFDFVAGPRIGSANGPRVTTGVLSPAVALDFGLQLGPHAAVLARAEIGTLAFESGASAYLISEWTPVPALSIGTGIGYDAMADFFGSHCEAGGRGCEQGGAWSAASVPLLFSLNLGHEHRLRVELEGALGYDPQTAAAGYHALATFGAVWR